MLKKTLTDGSPVPEDGSHNEIDPRTGQHKGYVVLSEEERKKGWVRPLRRSYQHVGERPTYPTRELTDAEHARYDQYGYVLYEEYPAGEGPVGRFWKADQLKVGCGTITDMGLALCETYARDPSFYGATFCCGCGVHRPVAEFTWVEDGERVGS